MIFDRQQQHLLLEGKEYTPEDIARFIAEGAENTPSALWDLYLFLNEWFNDSPVITVHTSGSTGTPKELIVRKDQMMQSARLTCEFLNLKQGESALLYRRDDVGGACFGCGTGSHCASRFRSSAVGCETAFEICSNGSLASL